MSGTFRSVLKSRNTDGQEFRNVFTFDYSGVSNSFTGAATEYFNSLLNATVLAATSSGVSFYGHDDYEWDGNEWQPIGTASLSKVGGAGGDALPNQVAGVVLAKTIGKRHIGRKFLPGMLETFNTAGVPTAGMLAALAAYLAVYAASYVATGGTLTGGVFNAINHVFFGFIGGTADALWGSQRRRKIGVGV